MAKTLSSTSPAVSATLSVLLASSLITVLLAWKVQTTIAGGTPVLLPHVCSSQEATTQGDGSLFWVRLLPHREGYLNNEYLRFRELKSAIAERMAPRSERVIYLSGSPDLSYGELLGELEELGNASSDTTIFLLTDSETSQRQRLPCVRVS